MHVVRLNYYQDAIDSLPPEEEKMMRECRFIENKKYLRANIMTYLLVFTTYFLTYSRLQANFLLGFGSSAGSA